MLYSPWQHKRYIYPGHLSWSGNASGLLFVLLCFQRVMLALIMTGGEEITHDCGNSTRVSRALRMAVYLCPADKYHRLTHRPSQEQKDLDERALRSS